jgi:16S rRNA processing protein RimM
LNDNREYIRIGRITGSHGLKGFVKVAVITDIDSRFAEGNRVFIFRDGAYAEHTVLSFAIHKERVAIALFSGISGKDGSDAISGSEIFIPAEEIETARGLLGESDFFYNDLFDLDVFFENARFGKVKGVLEAGSGHLLQIEKENGGEVLIPFVDEMVDTSRFKDGRIDITPVDGLLEA